MTRRLYGWFGGGKYFLSAFPATAEKRPAKQFDSKDELLAEVTRRAGPRLPAAVELSWDPESEPAEQVPSA